MKAALLISIAVFTVACDRSHQPRTASSMNGTSDTAKPAAAAASVTSTNAVTLVGCLQGPGLSGVTGTADTPAHGAQTRSFVLANAAVESGTAGANGAGVSGGTAVNAGSSFELDGVPADMQASVNKRVRVTGWLQPRVATTTGASGDTAGVRAASGSATAAPSTTGESSTRDDVRANSLGVAGDSTSHRLTVETLQVVAQQCGPQ